MNNILNIKQSVEGCLFYQQENKKIAFCAGYFDFLHVAYILFFSKGVFFDK